MCPKSPGLKVPREKGELLRQALIELGILDPHKKICSDKNNVFLPVKDLNQKALGILRDIGELEQIEFEFQEDRRRLTPEELLGFRPGYEVVGDIAIVDDDRADEVARALMSLYKSIKSVVTPVSDVEGVFRTRRFRHVAGEERTETVHREHGLRYRVDLEKAYFTQRMGTERLRVARQVLPGQVVLDMFAGVGPFALLFAKRGARVVAIEKNPHAVEYLQENALLNKVELEILKGDASELAPLYRNTADHVIMNLPHSASEFLSQAMTAARDGGVVHYYAIAPEDDLYGNVQAIARAADLLGYGFEVIYQGVVRSYSPRRFNVVIDFSVAKKG